MLRSRFPRSPEDVSQPPFVDSLTAKPHIIMLTGHAVRAGPRELRHLNSFSSGLEVLRGRSQGGKVAGPRGQGSTSSLVSPAGEHLEVLEEHPEQPDR
eukprot:2716513-Pyramimonas_sp.AAC.1